MGFQSKWKNPEDWAPGLTRWITSSKSLLGPNREAARTGRKNWAANQPTISVSGSAEKQWELVKVKLSSNWFEANCKGLIRAMNKKNRNTGVCWSVTVKIKDLLDLSPKLHLYFVSVFTNEEDVECRRNSRMLLWMGVWKQSWSHPRRSNFWMTQCTGARVPDNLSLGHLKITRTSNCGASNDYFK